MAIIESGGITPNKLVVNSEGRGNVQSNQISNADAEAIAGNGYNINTGDITLTNATKITALYIKNTGTKDIIVTTFIYLTGNSTAGAATADFVYTAIANPTAGGIITNTNDVDTNVNRRIGSSNTLTVVAYKGAQGETAVSGGTNLFGTRLSGSGRQAIPFLVTIPAQQSLAVDFTPKASNTNVIFQVAVACYERNLSTI
jgi:hypothetical protein